MFGKGVWEAFVASATGAIDAPIELIALVAGPLIVAVPLMLVMRPLFAWFLGLGAELFMPAPLPPRLARDVAGNLALHNIVVLAATWWAVIGSTYVGAPFMLNAVLAAAGVLLAIARVIQIIQSRLSLASRMALPIGLVTFAGGNIPLMVVLPGVLLFV